MDCLHYSSRCTMMRTCAVVLWIWLQALTTSCPPLLGWSSIGYALPMYSCGVTWTSSPSYTAFIATVSYLIPAMVILFCYVNIIRVARSHARRIHILEDSVQRSRCSNTAVAPSDSSHRHGESLQGSSAHIFHASGHFVCEGSYVGPTPPGSTVQNISASRRLFSFLAQAASQPPLQNSQQHQNHHGVVRLFLVISSFFLCWTPYICVALVQATETAVSGQSRIVPPSAATFSYWMVLLNSDINPLLYALLSMRFQAALQGLRQKIRACLGSIMGKQGEVRPQGEDGKSSDHCTLTTTDPRLPSNSEGSTNDDGKYSSSVSTASTDFEHNSGEHLCNVCHCVNTSQSSAMDSLQVPSWPQEGSRLPFSALTKAHQATFFFGQITVRVEHDVC